MSNPHHVCPDCLSLVEPDAESCLVCGRTQPDAGWGLDPLIGFVIGERYKLEGRLGEGGMASVYQATRQGALGGRVAIKILSPSLSRTVVARRFEREAQVVSQLSNPHVVRIYDFDSFPHPDGSQTLYYIAMELVGGRSLAGVLRQQPRVNFLWAIDLLRQTARGLDEAHALGIVHRDLKPSNLMIVQQHRATHVKILDFGIAAITDEEGASQVEKLTRTGLVTGTPDYMAPEQAMGRDDMGPPVDMYALGVIAFQLFAGRLPFTGHTAMDVLTQRVSKPAPSLMSTCPPPSLPPPIYNVVDKLLERDPAKRYQNAGELLDDLAVFPIIQTTPDFVPDEKMLEQYAQATQDGAAGTKSAPTIAGVGPVKTDIVSKAAPPEQKGSRWPLLAVLAVLLLGGGGAAAYFLTRGDGSGGAGAGTAGATPVDGQPTGPAGTRSGEPPAGGTEAGGTTVPKGSTPITLGYARPALEPEFEVVARAIAHGRTHVVALPKTRPPIYQPLPMRFAVDFAGVALKLTHAQATAKMADAKPIGSAKARVRPQDGRAVIDLPVFPLPGRYQIDISYTLPDETESVVTFTYDTQSGKVTAR